MPRTILVTGGAGFIGSALVRQLIAETDSTVAVVDALTYAGSLESLTEVRSSDRLRFERADVRDAAAMSALVARQRPDAIVHLAAESHVDRSIAAPDAFVSTNVSGTHVMLEAARAHFATLEGARRETFRFVQVSSDEVYGALGASGVFTESSPYRPSSPYAATKAAGDHLARAWHRTYGLPVIVTNSSNNYGPYQFPEKLIPLAILKAMAGEPIPVYARGEQVRDWLHVDDHARALRQALTRGTPGETYLIGARAERTNLQVVEAICGVMDELAPRSSGESHRALIRFVEDRPGHDFRYALDPARAEQELGWRPQWSFEAGLRETVRWYLGRRDWADRIRAGRYGLERLGLA